MTLPDGMTFIRLGTFQFCSRLSSVTIPSSVTEIQHAAFYGCTSLTDVYYGGSQAQWAAISFSTGNEDLKNATIHYNSK